MQWPSAKASQSQLNRIAFQKLGIEVVVTIGNNSDSQSVSFLQASLVSLRAFNADFFLENKTYLTGGVAVGMQFGLFRQALKINFVCASRTGFIAMRNAMHKNSIGELFAHDQNLSLPLLGTYDHACFAGSIRLATNTSAPMEIRYRVIFEPRIDLEGESHPVYKIPVLNRNYLFIAKLLSNTDRTMLPRISLVDIVDLATMIAVEGQIPDIAWRKACQVDSRVEAAFLSMANHAAFDDQRLSMAIAMNLARKDLACQKEVRDALAHQVALLSH